jgi:hypothetical protein
MRSLLEDDSFRKPQEIEIPADGISLDLLRAVYRSNQLPLTTRMRAAIAALPHEVPRLAVTAQITDNDIATILDRRLKRIEEMKLIEATNGAKVIGAKPQQVETKPPIARTNDRRFRRF